MATVKDVAYIRCRHHDLERQARFLEDFGLLATAPNGSDRAYRAAHAGPPCYIDEQAAPDDKAGLAGVGFFVERREELEEAVGFPDVTGGIAPLPPAFGGGEYVRLKDPDGLDVDLIHGAGSLPGQTLPIAPVFNYASEKARLGRGQRPSYAPAPVLRLGHLALLSPDPDRRMKWYLQYLGMMVSDAMHDDDTLKGVFMRCNRGDQWTDHHTVAVFHTSSDERIHHSSFEVSDLDALAVAGRWLKRRGWNGEWGLGRHILGSQIFDYWLDPEGLRIEHFTDGDMYTADKPPEHHPAGLDLLYQWGPDVPESWLP